MTKTSSPDDVDGDDYNVLYIGHSFGRVLQKHLEDYAHTAGFNDHAQYIEFSGGESGSPGLLWDDDGHQENIKAFLGYRRNRCLDYDLLFTRIHPNARYSQTEQFGTLQITLLRRTRTFASVWPCRGRIFLDNMKMQANIRIQRIDLYPYWNRFLRTSCRLSRYGYFHIPSRCCSL